MKKSRQLIAESLESRQLLHGGSILSGIQAALIERSFDRLDTNDDGVVLFSEEEGGDKVSERTWAAMADADVEGSEAGVTLEEFISYTDAQQQAQREELQQKIDDFRDRVEDAWGNRGDDDDDDASEGEETDREDQPTGIAGHVDSIFERMDKADEATGEADGLLSADELGQWADRFADAAGEDGLLSQDELVSYLEAKQEEAREQMEARAEEMRAKMAERISSFVDRIFEKKDVIDEATGEADGLLSAEELGGWANRFEELAGEDGLLSKDELLSHYQDRILGRHDQSDDDASEEETETDDADEVTEVVTETATAQVAAAAVASPRINLLTRIQLARESARRTAQSG